MNAISLFEHPRSPYAQKIRLLLREKNIAFTSTCVAGMGSGAEDPELRRLNPRREIPVIKVGGESIFDSTIILDYLEEQFPTPPLMPAEPLARARARMIEDVCDTQWEAINWGLGELYYFHRGDKALQTTLRAAGEHDAAIMYRWLEQQLGRAEWLSGDGFGWADLCAIPFAATSARFGVSPPAGSAIADWLARAQLRPSVRTTLAEAHAYHREMPEAVAALAVGAFKREYRDHRLEWILRAGGLAVVLDGLQNNSIRFTDLEAFAPEMRE